jgi:hypothetical protein
MVEWIKEAHDCMHSCELCALGDYAETLEKKLLFEMKYSQCGEVLACEGEIVEYIH